MGAVTTLQSLQWADGWISALGRETWKQGLLCWALPTPCEEARALAEYASARYRAYENPGPVDRQDYQALQQWMQKHK